MITTNDLLTRAIALLQDGRLDSAETLFRLLLVHIPDHADGLHLYGVLMRRRGEHDRAAALMRRALRSNPQLGVPHINLGLLHFDVGQVDAAEFHLRQMLVADPAYTLARARLANLLVGRGALDEAETLFRRMQADGTADERTPLALERCATYRGILAAAGDRSLPEGLVVRGVYRDSSGYAYKTRQFVKHLVAAGVPVQLMDLLYQPVDRLPDSQLDPVLFTLDRPVRARGVLQFTTPPVVERLPGLKTVNYSVIETTRVSRQWAEHSRRHDRVIVATQSSADAWRLAGCPADRVAICPEGVDPIDPAKVAPTHLVDRHGRPSTGYTVRFLNVSDFNPRKNLVGLLRVWLRATRRDDDAVLILKVGKGNATSGAFVELFSGVARALGVSPDQAAPILLVDATMSDEGMMSLFATATHYWSMSHGEGWDLPMTQAGAMGLTLLAPRHSAYTAYLDDGNAHLIPSPVVPAHGPYAGYEWWQPDEDLAVELVRQIIRTPVETRRSAREHLLRHFTWEQATRRLIDLLVEAGAL
ncbi:tetratricopeptide repeat protein [Azospirillum sp.]|uniref:tetratricopeptide repeat protein n=1 Tax=Azospirillum sp. TaxID=34012 RepID=UPI003D73A1DD